MNKNYKHRIPALILAFLMFFTSVGFSVDLHYCKGEFKSFSIFGEAGSCHTVKTTCPNHKNMVVDNGENKDCCNNEKIVIDQMDEDYTLSGDVMINNVQLQFITAYVHSFHVVNLHPPVTPAIFPTHNKPAPPEDIYVLLECYLL